MSAPCCGTPVAPTGPTGPGPSALVVDRHVEPDELRAALHADVRAGLTSSPKRLPAAWLYDERGGRLFDRITRLPEYYPTRSEQELLGAVAGEVAALARADTLVELGSGTSEKTRVLIDALAAAGTLRRFVPVDVDATTLLAAGASIAAEHPEVSVHAVVADFGHHLALLPTGGRRLVAFLGSTIGNLEPGPRAGFLRALAETLGPDDALLLGTDLVKDEARLVAAYDDAAGVTATFTANALVRLRRELGAQVDPQDFEPHAGWDPVAERVELGLTARRAVEVPVPGLGVVARFAAGERLRTEVSTKFRRAGVERELADAGLVLRRWWTDGDVALSLSRVAPPPAGDHGGPAEVA